MAGSYRHATDDQGRLRNWRTMSNAVENGGDAFETIEEFYGMVWWLANGEPGLVEAARTRWTIGIDWSPGYEPEHVRYPDEDDREEN